MINPLTTKQVETLRAVEDGCVRQANHGHSAWRIVGANPSVVGRLISIGLIRWNATIGGTAELTDTGKSALAAAREFGGSA